MAKAKQKKTNLVPVKTFTDAIKAKFVELVGERRINVLSNEMAKEIFLVQWETIETLVKDLPFSTRGMGKFYTIKSKKGNVYLRFKKQLKSAKKSK